ncbi:MAG: type III polyketide synthase [Elainellaceae cyanobacterium]
MKPSTLPTYQSIENRISFQQVFANPGFNGHNAGMSSRFLPVIESIATETPEYTIQQSDAAQVVANLSNLEHNRHRIEKLYRNTQIDTRHLAINLLSDEAIAFSKSTGNIESRMQRYQKYAVPLAERVAQQAIESASVQMKTHECGEPDSDIKDSIHQIVFVSSTGFVAPGVDVALIEKLGLRRDIARVTVNFMGCAAAMNGLRVACDHVRAYPTHKVLLVCLELSSVNAAFEDNLNDVIIHSIFGDGCAAVVVGAREGADAMGGGNIVIHDHLSYLVEDTQDGITLGVRDNGITCELSRQLPDYIEVGVGPIIERYLMSHQLKKDDINLWAVHPGGTRIIQKVQQSLGLSDDQVCDSWSILRQYGNMLSPSVLFVIERMLQRLRQNPCSSQRSSQKLSSSPQVKALTGLAFSFSPGVGIEGILFQVI